MTGLEIFLSMVLWVIIGLWISWKRTWYKDNKLMNDEKIVTLGIVLNIVLMPLVLLWTIFDEYANDDWKQEGK